MIIKEESNADIIYNHINGKRGGLHMKNEKITLMSVVAPSFYELVNDLPNGDMCYIGGHMLNKANAERRIKEADEIRNLGYKVWNPIEDKSINSKDGLDKHTNDNLSKRIVRNDTVGILKSNHIVIEPETFAIGSCVETGMIFGYKHIAMMLREILDNRKYDDAYDLIDDLEKLIKLCNKNVYPHLDDIRAENDIEEVNYNRSWSVNQFLRGVTQGLTNKEEGFYDWGQVIKELYGMKNE